jgi:E3 ubiquitin-protein ligase NEDD4
VNEESVLAVQIFDQKKFKKKDQGFLGVINVRIGSVIDLDAGGDGTPDPCRVQQNRLTVPRDAHARPQEVE